MAISLIILLLLAVFAVSVRTPRRGPREGMGVAVRRFFQYAVQFALVCIVATGLSVLLGRLLQRDLLVAADPNALAQGLSFTLVGVPLLWLIARWTRRRMAADPREVMSLPWGWYLALAEVVPLAVAMASLQTVLAWLLRGGDYDGGAIARTLMWGAAWWVHRRITLATTPGDLVRDHQLAASAYGLWTAAIGLAQLVSAALRNSVTLSGKAALLAEDHPVAQAVSMLVVGLAVWAVYWLRRLHAAARTLHWHVYVMIVGVGAGLVTAITSASVALYDLLVWFVGTPETKDAADHFRGSMTAAGALVAGLLVWWYHRTVLREVGATARNEAQRVYEYVVSVIALAAAAIGIAILLVAGLETITASAQITGRGAGNTVLLAATLLIVGGPMWLWFWRAIQRAFTAAPSVEAASPTRRVYLFLLFGVVGVAALIALLVVAYQLFADAVAGHLGIATLRTMRWGIAVLVTAAVVASYHWRIYREEREAVAPPSRRTALIVAPDPEPLREVLEDRLHAKVEVLRRTDCDGVALPDADALVSAVEGCAATEVLVLVDGSGVRVIPVDRD